VFRITRNASRVFDEYNFAKRLKFESSSVDEIARVAFVFENQTRIFVCIFNFN